MKKKFFDAPYVITQKQKEFEDQNILGHKGLEYFKLSEKAKISPFFILTTTAFDHFVQSSLLVDPIVDQICKVDINDPESTDKASKNISDILNKASLPSIILNPLKVAFDSIKQDKNVYFKIIPSFIFSEKFIPKEAPNFEMNISSFENLLEQIKHGWSFLFSKEALLLRAQNFYQGNLSIALIIQKIVNPEASGNAKFMADRTEISAFFGCQHPEIAGADKYIVEGNQITEKYIVPQDKLAIRVFKDPNKKYKTNRA
ncbi:MAG: hypothetical protein KatS3mg085_532 [Candidatus Dojkabacteria bacterium]|nr:MAG: hypothetical protein KatS3mg085_532 [Candidatus Dojkabacteria bacterium]